MSMLICVGVCSDRCALCARISSLHKIKLAKHIVD